MEPTSKQHAGKSPWYERLFGVTFLRSVFALMLREMATTFGRSPGGYVWAIAEPVAAVAMLSIVFSIAFRNPPLGVNFALFYATGMLPFLMYADLSMKVGQSIRYSRPLLSYASVTFIDAILGRLILNTLTAIVVSMIVITGIILAFGLRVDIDVLRILNALGMILVLCLGLGTFNCYMFGAFPIWERLWGILNRPMFLLSGVFFLVENMPRVAREIMLMNPLTHVISEFRAGLYSIYDGRYVSPLYVYAFGLIFLVLGLLLLYRHHRYLISEGA